MAAERSSSSLTELLQRYGSGERDIADPLFRQIWPVLRELARRQLSHERFVAPVSPTELINELWLRSLHRGGWKIGNRHHFYAIVSLAMRRVLIDLARQRLAVRRHAAQVPLPSDNGSACAVADTNNLEQIVGIGLLMERLEQRDRVGALIFDMHYFAGYTLEEIAETNGLTLRQVSYRWDKAQRWIKKCL